MVLILVSNFDICNIDIEVDIEISGTGIYFRYCQLLQYLMHVPLVLYGILSVKKDRIDNLSKNLQSLQNTATLCVIYLLCILALH